MNLNRGSGVEQRLPLYISRSHKSTDVNKTGAWRIMCPEYQEKTSPCSVACPLGEDIARIQILTADGNFKEAWETILMENPFPSVCGRVCYHPCEASCNRRDLDQAVAVQMMERFLGDTADRYGFKASFEKPESKKQKISIVGSGPSGLSAAYFLSRLGYACDVFEGKSEPGGILRWGIPGYRLPTDVLKREIRFIEDSGVTIHCDYNVSHALLKEMAGQYDAVFLGCGYGRDLRLKIPGERYAIEGTEFLSRVKMGDTSPLHGIVAVLGGGNTAVDAARCVARLGGEPVIIYRRRRQDMYAFPEEVKMAMEEGVKVLELRSPVSIERKETEYILTLQEMRFTDPDGFGNTVLQSNSDHREQISFASVIKAIGREAVDFRLGCPGKGDDILPLGNCVMSFEQTGFIRVFGGDPIIEIKSVADAAASGKVAAIALDIYFNEGRHAVTHGLEECAVEQGLLYSMAAYLKKECRTRSNQIVTFESINTDYFPVSPRIEQPRLLRGERVKSFSEINLKVSARSSIRESERCFNCGTCNQCNNCYIFCPEVAVILDESNHRRHIDYKGCGVCGGMSEECNGLEGGSHMKRVLEGSQAVAEAVKLAKVQVISAYPITPQTHIVEYISEYCASGKLNARFIRVESEHSAMAALIGGATAGARTFTSTSSQGLALMHELLHWASGARLPIVMAEVNRALAPAWNVWADQTDSLAQRDTGWIQLYCEDSQEVLDTTLQAFRLAESVNLPVMVVLDAFYLSHTYEPVDVPNQEQVDAFLPPYLPRFQMDVENPRAFSQLAPPGIYMEFRRNMQDAMEHAIGRFQETEDAFSGIFERRYGVVETVLCEDAEVIIVTSGTVTSTCRHVIESLRKKGEKAGLLKIKMFRPFPAEFIRQALGHASKAAVIDRNFSFGASGIFAQEIRASLCNMKRHPMVFGYVAGLGGRDITPEMLEEIYWKTKEEELPEPEDQWMGLREVENEFEPC